MEQRKYSPFLLLFVPEFSLLGFLVLGFSLTAPPSLLLLLPSCLCLLPPAKEKSEVLFCFLWFLFQVLIRCILFFPRLSNKYISFLRIVQQKLSDDPLVPMPNPVCRNSHLFHSTVSTLPSSLLTLYTPSILFCLCSERLDLTIRIFSKPIRDIRLHTLRKISF